MAELAVLASSIASAAGSAAATAGSAIASAATAAAPYATAASLGGTLLEGGMAIAQGNAEAKAAQRAAAIQKQQLEAKANEERAAAGREAQERRREGELVKSRQIAVASASGGGTNNPTILDIIGDTEARADYLTKSSLYGGEQRARGLKDQANFGTWQAKTQAGSAKAKGNAAFAGSLLEGFETLGKRRMYG